jgi:hypothetical protein
MIGVTTESHGGLQHVRIEGSLSLAELAVLLERYRDSTPEACLIDLSEASAMELPSGDVRALAKLSAANGFPRPGTRVGLIAPNPVTYGVCRMLQGLRTELEDGLGVFSSEAEAAAWIRRQGRSARA